MKRLKLMGHNHPALRRAFTLIELLTVMAITAVMMTLIVLPIFQSFNFTRTAQAFADAQDKGRLLVDRISREVGNAILVRGGSIGLTRLNQTNILSPTDYGQPGAPNGSVVVRVPNKGRTAVVEVLLPNAKLDLVPPAQGNPGDKINGAYIDPNTGKGDPTLTRPKGDIRLPVASGATIVRYFIGLNRAVTEPVDPTETPQPLAYNEPYTGLLMARGGNRDNLYVLRRVEVQPYIYRPRKDFAPGDTSPAAEATKAWRPNLQFFRSDDNVGTPGYDTQLVDVDDPRFFIPDQGQIQGVNDNGNAYYPGKNRRVLNWQKASVVQTEISRYDMIRPATTGSAATPTVTYTGPNNDVPQLVPLIQFRPTRVASAPAAGSAAARPGEAVDGLDRIGPDTYRTERGLWTNAFVRHYPGGYVPGLTDAGLMQIATADTSGATVIWNGQVSDSGFDAIHDAPDNFALFNLQVYEQALAQGQSYPFTAAAVAADIADRDAPTPGRYWTSEARQRLLFTPFRVITATGRLVTSFSIDEVGTGPVPNGGPNLPRIDVRNMLTPIQAGMQPGTPPTLGDPDLLTAPLSPQTTGTGYNATYHKNTMYDVNQAYNRVFNQYPELRGVLERFIDLRMVPNADGTFSPLYPGITPGEVHGFSFPTGMGGNFNRVRIVPGSETVYGPDQRPGGNYGRQIRYTRVSANPDINQYRLVYADLAEPSAEDGSVSPGAYETVLGLSNAMLTANGGFDPAGYNPENVVSAVIQPRYKAGYLQLCSDPNHPIPLSTETAQAAPITVSYRFQFNGPNDTFAVDHDTREVMQILLTIKNYPQSNAPAAQTVTLKSTATLRNALR